VGKPKAVAQKPTEIAQVKTEVVSEVN